MGIKLSATQEQALLVLSNRGASNIAEKTLLGLETLKLARYCEDGWRLTPAGQAASGLIRKYKPTGALAGLLEKHLELNREPRTVHPHDLRYMAEKLRQLFGPVIDENPEAKTEFIAILADGTSTRRIAL